MIPLLVWVAIVGDGSHPVHCEEKVIGQARKMTHGAPLCWSAGREQELLLAGGFFEVLGSRRGKEIRTKDWINRLLLTPGGRVVCIIEGQNSTRVEIDGNVVGPEVDGVGEVFIGDRDRVAFEARQRGKQKFAIIVENEREIRWFDELPTIFAFSPDDQKYAYAAKTMQQDRRLIEIVQEAGSPELRFSEVHAVRFSAKNELILHARDSKDRFELVRIGQREFHSPRFKDLHVEGDRVGFVAVSVEGETVFVDEEQFGPFRFVKDFQFDREGKHFIFIAYRDDSEELFVNGRSASRFNQIQSPPRLHQEGIDIIGLRSDQLIRARVTF